MNLPFYMVDTVVLCSEAGHTVNVRLGHLEEKKRNELTNNVV